MEKATSRTMVAISLLLMMMDLSQELKTWNLTVQPNFKPPIGNIAMCTLVKVPRNESWAVVHMDIRDARPKTHPGFLLCTETGYDDETQHPPVWDCGDNSPLNTYPKATSCADGVEHLGIANGPLGPRLNLPPGVGFRVGGNTGMHAIILWTHYPHTDREYVDNKTFVLTIAQAEEGEEEPASVNTMSFRTYAWMPLHSVSILESFYEVMIDTEVHPIATLAHCHETGCRTEVWVVSRDGEWTPMGRRHRKRPESDDQRASDMTVTSLPVEHPERVIVKGDRIVSRCIIPNPADVPVLVGATGDSHEMCLAHFMYFTKDGRELDPAVVINDHVRDNGVHGFDWSDDPVLRSHHQPMHRNIMEAEARAATNGGHEG